MYGLPLTIKLTKERMEKCKESDKNITRIMTQLDTLSKNVNVVGVGYVNLDEAKFEACTMKR